MNELYYHIPGVKAVLVTDGILLPCASQDPGQHRKSFTSYQDDNREFASSNRDRVLLPLPGFLPFVVGDLGVSLLLKERQLSMQKHRHNSQAFGDMCLGRAHRPSAPWRP